MDIPSLMTLCKLAVGGVDKAIQEYKKRKFSEPEKQLLIAAAQKGEFYVLSADGVPDWIRIERKSFPSDIGSDPADSAKYHDAFEGLCKRGFIRHEGGILFRLTSLGFKTARKLAKIKKE